MSMSMSMSMDIHNHNHHDDGNLKLKTELCRRFREGACFHGSKCKYAHGVAELRQGQPPNKLCRLFVRYNYKHCPYGRSCRFLHSSPSPFPSFPQPPPRTFTFLSLIIPITTPHSYFSFWQCRTQDDAANCYKCAFA